MNPLYQYIQITIQCFNKSERQTDRQTDIEALYGAIDMKNVRAVNL